jgi:hypothetical protein
MPTKLRYDYNLLKSICDEGGVTLLNNYEDLYITRDTRIIGKCILCDNSFDKSLNKLHKQKNYGCLSCAKLLKTDRIKGTMLEKYGVEHAVQSEFFRDKMKKTTFERYGVEYGLQNEDVKAKIRQTNLETYGCEYGLQNEEVKNKKKVTYLKNYGVENPNQCKEIRDKTKQTNLEKYGVEHACQSEEIKAKVKQTNLEKYGYEYGFQNEEIKAKIVQTCLDKYGVEHVTQATQFKEKTKQTNLEKYGVEYVCQNPDILEKSIKTMYKFKEYIMPSRNILQIQGYEHYALDYLLQTEMVCEDDIVTGCKNVPIIWYIDIDGKKRRHFVDIFIHNQNRCIEVKSTWTAHINKHTIFLKQLAAKELGYNYEIWVYNDKGQIVDKHL